MKILISGSNGLVGRSLVPPLNGLGHEVIRLLRGAQSAPRQIGYNAACVEPSNDFIRSMDAAQPEVVIHLAGENIARHRWTEAQKKRIHNSRVNSTLMLTRAFERMQSPPRRFIVASAVGIYGNAGEDILTEESPTGFDFLANVCKDWEETARKAEASRVEVTNLRFGLILSSQGGPLAMMLPAFQMFIGARLGSGQQWMSWVSLTDVIHAIRWIIENKTLRGPVNVVAPNPVRNVDFTRILAQFLNRPAFMRAPAFVLKAALGEMAEMLLASQRVFPSKLQNAGFTFKHPHLIKALEAELERSAPAIKPSPLAVLTEEPSIKKPNSVHRDQLTAISQ